MREDEHSPAEDEGSLAANPPADAAAELSAATADPSEIPPELTGEELAEAQRYGRAQLYSSLVDKGIDLVYLAVFAFWFARPLDSWLSQWVASPMGRLPLMYLCVFLGHAAVSFPVSFYSGHVLEHRHGLSRQSLRRWLSRYVKHLTLGFLMMLVALWGLYGINLLTGAWWWLWTAVAFFVFSVVLGQLFPVLILPLFYKIERFEDERLMDRMERLAAGTGLNIEGVYRIVLSEETAKGNAMLAGMGPTRRVIMGDTLLADFTPDELEVIFAHEIGHHVHRHIPQLVAVGAGLSVLGLYLCDRALALWAGVPNFGETPLPVAGLPMLLLLITVFSLLMEPVQNVISRHFERQCDRYALRRTGNRTAYISAFRKLARLNKDDPAPHPLAVFLFHSHPPISERLAMPESEV